MNGKSISDFKKVAMNNNSLSKRTLVFGKGVNDAWYKTHLNVNGKGLHCPVYSAWIRMLRRSYDPKFHEKEPTYANVEVCDDWLKFSNYAKWHEKNYIDGFQLDKDLKVKGNKEYNPLCCMYVPKCLNNLIIDSGASRGEYPEGVHLRKNTKGGVNRYYAQISSDGKRVHVGSFLSVDLAFTAYKKAKNKEILKKCEQYPEFAVYLKNHLYDMEC